MSLPSTPRRARSSVGWAWPSSPPASRAKKTSVLVGLPPGARHDLGALTFATAARRAGIAVRYLGADLPVSDWLEAIASTKARGVVIGVVIGRDVEAALDVARSIRATHPHVLIAFGGGQAAALPTDGLEPLLVLPQDLPSAVQALRTELSASL